MIYVRARTFLTEVMRDAHQLPLPKASSLQHSVALMLLQMTRAALATKEASALPAAE